MRASNYRHIRRVQMQERARYYSWCALRKHCLSGNDPQTGRARSSWRQDDVAESRAAYIALARYWLAEAARPIL